MSEFICNTSPLQYLHQLGRRDIYHKRRRASLAEIVLSLSRARSVSRKAGLCSNRLSIKSSSSDYGTSWNEGTPFTVSMIGSSWQRRPYWLRSLGFT